MATTCENCGDGGRVYCPICHANDPPMLDPRDAEIARLRESCKLLDAEANTAAKAASTRNRDVEVLTAEIAALKDTIAQVRAHEFTAKHEKDCVAHVHGGRYCTCWVERWQEGYDAALEAVAGILGEAP